MWISCEKVWDTYHNATTIILRVNKNVIGERSPTISVKPNRLGNFYEKHCLIKRVREGRWLINDTLTPNQIDKLILDIYISNLLLLVSNILV